MSHALDPETQDLALTAARAAMSSDSHLDRETTSVHLPVEIADALLTARGWRVGRGAFIAPDGERYWVRSEALTVALTAEAFDIDPELTEAI